MEKETSPSVEEIMNQNAMIQNGVEELGLSLEQIQGALLEGNLVNKELVAQVRRQAQYVRSIVALVDETVARL